MKDEILNFILHQGHLLRVLDQEQHAACDRVGDSLITRNQQLLDDVE